MIYVYQILKQIRLNNQYNANSIAPILHVSAERFRKLENEFSVLFPPLLISWLIALDIHPREHDWYLQKNEREYAYVVLAKNFPNIPKQVLERIADILTFFNKIQGKQDLDNSLMKFTLPHILLRPRSADVVMDQIKDAK